MRDQAAGDEVLQFVNIVNEPYDGENPSAQSMRGQASDDEVLEFIKRE